jgi:hypothetical protein
VDPRALFLPNVSVPASKYLEHKCNLLVIKDAYAIPFFTISGLLMVFSCVEFIPYPPSTPVILALQSQHKQKSNTHLLKTGFNSIAKIKETNPFRPIASPATVPKMLVGKS